MCNCDGILYDYKSIFYNFVTCFNIQCLRNGGIVSSFGNFSRDNWIAKKLLTKDFKDRIITIRKCINHLMINMNVSKCKCGNGCCDVIFA